MLLVPLDSHAAWLSALRTRLRRIKPEHVFWVVIGLLLLAYLLVLWTQASAVGRGGR